MTVGELLARISSRELSEWQAYFLLEKEEQEWEEKKRKNKKGAR